MEHARELSAGELRGQPDTERRFPCALPAGSERERAAGDASLLVGFPCPDEGLGFNLRGAGELEAAHGCVRLVDRELGPVKTHEQRTVPLLASLVSELQPLVSRDDAEALVFTAAKGGALHYNNFRSQVFNPAVKATGLDGLGLTPYKLRHTAASLAIAAGADVKVVQTMSATGRP